MAGYQGRVSGELPFFGISDKELNTLFGRRSDRRDNLDLYDLFLNHDRFDECDPDLMLTVMRHLNKVGGQRVKTETKLHIRKEWDPVAEKPKLDWFIILARVTIRPQLDPVDAG